MKPVTDIIDQATERSYRELDFSYHMHAFNNNKRLGETGCRIINEAHGCYIFDEAGNRYLDCMAGLWAVNMGYGQVELVRAITEQLSVLPYYNTFFKSSTPPTIDLAVKLAQLTPAGLNRVFFGSSGSEANDTIVKLARYYWQLKGYTEKNIIISRDHAYHGSAMFAASLSAFENMHKRWNLPFPDVLRVPAPYWFKYGREQEPERFARDCALKLEECILQTGADKIAAFIAEPIQGAGGVIVPPDGYWREIQRICREYDILLIVDEVITGFGRTGEWFGCDTYNIKPDFMTLAKGISSAYFPVSAVLIADHVAETIYAADEEFGHGYTYSGHPVGCAAALKNIELMESAGIIRQVKEDTGPYLQGGLKELSTHPLVGDVRGVGMLGAFEIVKDKDTMESFDHDLGVTGLLQDICYQNGLILRAVGDSMAVSPPLIITKSEIDELVQKSIKSLNTLIKKL